MGQVQPLCGLCRLGRTRWVKRVAVVAHLYGGGALRDWYRVFADPGAGAHGWRLDGYLRQYLWCSYRRTATGRITAVLAALGSGWLKALLHFGPFDHHRFMRDILKRATAAGGHTLDGVDHVHAFNNPSEHRITPGLTGGGALVVKEAIVFHVDEKLRGCRVGGAGTCHGQRAAFIAQAMMGFVRDGIAGGFLPQVLVEAAALDHEAVNHAVEHRAIVMAFFYVGQEVFNACGRLLLEQLDGDGAMVGMQYHIGGVGMECGQR